MGKFVNNKHRVSPVLANLKEKVAALNNLDDISLPPLPVLNEGENTDARVVEISDLCSVLFIDQDGQVDERAIAASGLSINPYNQDSFGWLKGALITRKGLIIFE